MKNRDVIISFAMLILIGIIIAMATQTHAQILLQQEVEDIALDDRNTLTWSTKTDQFAEYLLKAVTYGDQRLFDLAFENYDCSWFYSVDVYIDDNIADLLETMRLNEEANFRDPDITEIAIAVKTDGVNYLVLITTYP